MKIPFSTKLATPLSTALTEGRYVGTVIQIANIGNQPAFNAGDDPVPSVGVVLQLDGTQIAKSMRFSDNQFSSLHSYFEATLPDPDSYEGNDPLPLTLGQPVAIEVIVKGQYAKIASFHRPEDFELSSAPKVAPDGLIMFEGLETMTNEAGKAIFMKLHRDIRSWISKRVRD